MVSSSWTILATSIIKHAIKLSLIKVGLWYMYVYIHVYDGMFMVYIHVHNVGKNCGPIIFHWNSNVGVYFVSHSLFKLHCFKVDIDMVMSLTYEKFKTGWWDEFPYMQKTCINPI